MTLIQIDKDTCNKCGICATQCNMIIYKEGSYPRQMPGTDEFCMRCGHCVAVCPTGSLTHKEMPAEQTPPVNKKLEISFAQCTQLIKSRRSIRNYQDKAVPKEEIERIIDVARYAPTGHNAQDVRWLVINDRAYVDKIRAIGADWLRWLMKSNPQMAAMFAGIVKLLDMGKDMFIQGAPALVTAYGDKNNPMCATDCAIALSYFDLSAKSAGLGCCWAGFFYMSAASYPPMIEAIGLPEGSTPYGALMVGYPVYKYQRIPARKPAERYLPSVTQKTNKTGGCDMAYKTENNIQEAFGGESKAYRRYVFFAEKAEKEGFPQVAKLFRAVAEAEIVHARNHLNAIDAIGSTKDNLLAASLGEQMEFTKMYPVFIDIAREEKNDRAECTFDWANKVEKVHYGYFEAAFKDLKEGKKPADAVYYVCQVCGNTVKGDIPDKCQVCGSGAKAFKKID